MATLSIYIHSAQVAQHIDSVHGEFIISKMYCKSDGVTFKVTEAGGSQRRAYALADVTVYDYRTGSGSAETFGTMLALMERLAALQYVGFYQPGEVILADLISSDSGNAIVLGTDGKLYSAGGGDFNLQQLADAREADIASPDGKLTIDFNISTPEEGIDPSQTGMYLSATGTHAVTGDDVNSSMSMFREGMAFAGENFTTGMKSYFSVGGGEFDAWLFDNNTGINTSSLKFNKDIFEISKLNPDDGSVRRLYMGNGAELELSHESDDMKGIVEVNPGSVNMYGYGSVTDPTIELSSLNVSHQGVFLAAKEDTSETRLEVDVEGINISSTTPLSKGLTSTTDFTANATGDLDYVQRKGIEVMIDDAIAGAGGGTVTSVTGVAGETTVASGTTTPVVGIDAAYTAARDDYADSKVSQSIANGVTDKAPSADAVVGYVGIIDVESYGAIPDGTTDATAAIQSAITNNVGTVVRIGSKPSDVYLIKQEIIVPAGSLIQIDGTVKLVAAPTQLLTANVSDGQSTIQVTDGSQFAVNDLITFSDDNQPINGGGSWKTRKVSTTGRITGIAGNTLTFANPFTAIINGGVTVAANAKIAKADNMFTCDNSDNTIIFGKGVLDGNKANRWNVAGATYNHLGEDLASNCGISFSRSDNFRILGNLTIKNFVMHGISTAISNTTKSANCIIDGVTIDGVVDKSICVIDLIDSRISNIRNMNGVDEGEIAVYSGNYNVLITDIFSENNKRYGVALIGNFNGNITVNNLYSKNVQGAGLYIQNQLEGTNVSNVTFTGDTTSNGGLAIQSSKNVDLKNIKFNGMILANGLIGIGGDSYGSPYSEGIRFDGLGVKNCNYAGSSMFSFSNAVDVLIENFSIDGAATLINDISGTLSDNIVFRKGLIKGTTALFNVNGGHVRFKEVTGDWMFETSSTATMPSGATKIIITHGIAVTPKIQDIRVNPIGVLGSATKWWVSNVNSTDFTINVDVSPGVSTAKFRWNIETYLGEPITEAVYTNNYSSDFSATADGFAAATATTVTGNNDAVTDGTTSYDDVLKVSPTAVAGSHVFSKTSAFANTTKQTRVTFKYFVPAGQAMNGFRLYHGVAMSSTVEIIGLTSGREKHVQGTWVEVASGYFIPSSTTMYGRLFVNTSNSFTGLATEYIAIRDFKVEYLP